MFTIFRCASSSICSSDLTGLRAFISLIPYAVSQAALSQSKYA